MRSKIEFLASHFAYYVEELDLSINDEDLKKILSNANKNEIELIKNDYMKYNYDLSPENFIIYSDNIFNVSEKRENGIEYTPITIAKKMSEMILAEYSLEFINDLKIIDPAVGGGIFLVSIVRLIHQKTNIKVDELIKNNIYGVDKVPEQILLCKLSLYILSAEYSSKEPEKYNLYNLNSFELNESNPVEVFGVDGFDIVITNPPYIRSKHLESDQKEYLKKKYESVFGIVDSYIPFFEVSVGLLKPGGYSIQITPNSFLTSLNGRSLRKYLIKKSKSIKIINFNAQQLFNGVSSYSAITFIQKKNRDNEIGKVSYLNESLEGVDFSEERKLNWIVVRQKDTWRTLNDDEMKIVDMAEHKFNTKLADLKFKNGVATQRNNIYSFSFNKKDENYYYFIYNNAPYKIEKDVTRPFITPNEKNQPVNQRIIFPYRFNIEISKTEVIPESEMKEYYPNAYIYLSSQRDELDSRASDSSMPEWYAYGRSQGLNDFGNRLYLPYMADKVHTSVSSDNSEVFAAGYAIYHENIDYLYFLGDILTSDFFSYYISLVSKPYSKKYYSTAKNLIKNFSIPSELEVSSLNKKSNLSNKDIFKLYGLNASEIDIIVRMYDK